MKKGITLFGFTTFLLIFYLLICFISFSLLGNYFLWMHLDRNVLTLFGMGWRKIFYVRLPFDTRIVGYVPLIPISVIMIYFVGAGLYLNLRIYLRGRRVHHFHVGLLVTIMGFLLFLFKGESTTIIRLCGNVTTLTDILQNLGMSCVIGGLLFVILDGKDLKKTLNSLRKRICPNNN